MTDHVIGTTTDFPEGTGTEVLVDGLQIAVFNVDGEFTAVSGRCPHKGAPLALAGSEKYAGDGATGEAGPRGGIDAENCTVSCPWHGLKFDLETGDSPATRYRVRPFEVTVEGDDVVLSL